MTEQIHPQDNLPCSIIISDVGAGDSHNHCTVCGAEWWTSRGKRGCWAEVDETAANAYVRGRRDGRGAAARIVASRAEPWERLAKSGIGTKAALAVAAALREAAEEIVKGASE